MCGSSVRAADIDRGCWWLGARAASATRDEVCASGSAANETVQVVNDQGVAVPVTLDRDLIFSADVVSQNEIEDIASSPAAQLLLLDRFQEHESLEVERDIEQLRRQIEQSSVRRFALCRRLPRSETITKRGRTWRWHHDGAWETRGGIAWGTTIGA